MSQSAHEEIDSRVAFGVDSYLGRMVARLLMLVLLTQPVYVALGMELESSNETVEERSATSPTSDKEGSSVVEHESEEIDSGGSQDEVLSPDTLLRESEQHTDDVTSPANPTTDASAAHDATVVTDTPVPNGVPGEEEGAADDSALPDDRQGAKSVDDGNIPLDEPESLDTVLEELPDDAETSRSAVDPENIASSTVAMGMSDETSSTSVASTTDDVPPAQVDDIGTTTTRNASNRYVFGEGECTLVAEGEFYCIAGGPERQMAEDPRVYTERDREGDREIYYFDGVAVRRITNNSYDDFAAVFDEETQRIVWQANIADRMQIMLYDLPTNTTRQVTTGRMNSSNPDIRGDTIVWQEWVDTNWEVMLATVHDIGGEFTFERLTDNAVHDLFPQVYDNTATWQSERGRSWEIVVYDLATKKRTTLEKSEDTKYENPRFALLFDSRHENGDVETIGYALDTGEMMELGTKANPQPVIPTTPKQEIPDAPPQASASSTLLKVKSEGDTVTGGDGDGTPDMAGDPSEGSIVDLSTLSHTQDTP